MTNKKEDRIKLLLTNARSLSPKIASLHEIFDAHDIDIALITESWLKDGAMLDRDVIDLELGSGLQIIYKNRPRKGASARRVGGGVSIIFNKARCNLKERKLTGNKFELVAAIGRVGKVQRQVAVFCVYIEPRMKVADLASLNDLLSREILQLKAKGDPIIFLGGDLNHRQLDDAVGDFADMTRQNYDATRGPACLDVLFANVDMPSMVWPPLVTQTGIPSDHSCVVFSGTIPHERDFVWERVTTRKHTQQAVDEFGRRMENTDWSVVLPLNSDDPDAMVAAFENYIQTTTDELFPMQTIRRRSNEPEWISNGIRKLSRQKKRVYRREGKSRLWYSLCERIDTKIEENKLNYVDKVKADGPRAFYKGIKKISAGIQTQDWSIMDLFPGKTKKQAGEETSAFFTAISDQFTPLPTRRGPPSETREPVSLPEVVKALKDAKKPSSMVRGDVLPRLMKAHYTKIAFPVMSIFNAVFRSGDWPARWKEETVVVIPKTNNPDSLASCRNISCTAFLSKVLESIMLADLRSQIAPDPNQYGGISNCSVDHLLVDLFDRILEPLEDGGAAVVLGVDFKKAFNRLDHLECVEQLKKLGARTATIELIRSFLSSRTMMVKIGDYLSEPRKLCGGSPQGSILGCLLYCLTTQQIDGRPSDPPVRMPTNPPAHQEQESEVSSDEEYVGFGLMGSHEVSPDRTPTEEMSAVEGPAMQAVRAEARRTITTFKYVDDTTTVEAVPPGLGIRHITAATTLEKVPADLTEGAMNSIIEAAGDIGMVVNCKKTQLLCISGDNGCSTTAAIREPSGQEINSVRSMKLLGFMLTDTPDVSGQVAMLKTKFRAKFWGLINLRRAGLKGKKLYKLYCSLVRPVLECNSVVFHTMLTRAQSNELEKLQRQAIRLSFGFAQSTEQHIVAHGLQTLEERRTTALRKFTAKIMKTNGRFKERWLVPRPNDAHGLRNRRPFVEQKAKTTRYYNSPLLAIQRTANDICTA